MIPKITVWGILLKLKQLQKSKLMCTKNKLSSNTSKYCN